MNEKILVDKWLAVRTEAGKKIDPETAEVMWKYGQTLDPYNVYPDLSEEEKQIGRCYFARSPGSDVWVSYGDLPDETLAALRGSPQEHRTLEAQEEEFNSLDWLFEDAE